MEQVMLGTEKLGHDKANVFGTSWIVGITYRYYSMNILNIFK